MNDKQDLKELAQLSEIFAEAAFEYIAKHPTLVDQLDDILGTDDATRLYTLEHDIALAVAAIEMDFLLGGVEKDKAEEYLEEINDRIAPMLISLGELYARVVEHASVMAAAGLLPEEARSQEISEKFAKAGAPTLARLAAFRPSPPAFGFIKKPRL